LRFRAQDRHIAAMDQALVLVGDPARAALPARALDRLAGRSGARARWLAPDAAFEAVLGAERMVPFREEVTALLENTPADLVVLPAAGREKALLISDMDSTMITVECIDELADLVGCKAEVAAITRRAMNGELDFAAALDARVALLAGLDPAVLDEVYEVRVRLMPGALELVRTMRARGALTVLVSGGFLPIVERVRDRLGFHRAAANRLEVKGGTLTGRVLRPVLGAADKLHVLEEERARGGLADEVTLAVGDGANDLPMIGAAGLGVAFRAHPEVRRRAPVAICVGDLTALLYLQGIAAADFACD
jgi:phosphoserine phosphatase